MSNEPEQENDAVAFCVTCANTIPDSRAEKDVFLQAGKPGLCPFCGGVVVVTWASEVSRLKERIEKGETIRP